MKNYILAIVRRMIQLIVYIVFGMIFIMIMDNNDVFYIGSKYDDIIYIILYSTGISFVQHLEDANKNK